MIILQKVASLASEHNMQMLSHDAEQDAVVRNYYFCFL